MAVSSLIIQLVTLLELRRDCFCLNSLFYKIKVRKKEILNGLPESFV